MSWLGHSVLLCQLKMEAHAACFVQLIEKIRDHRGLLSTFLHRESRFHKLLKTFPLYAVTHERTGLVGTREYAIRLLGQPSLIKAT